MTKLDLSDVRGDHRILCDFVAPGSRVLDIGCGTGELLELLIDTRGVDGRGFDTSQKGVNEAVARGLSVVQGDADNDLAAYPDDAFDYAILSHTLQATMDPKQVLEQLLRIGKKVVVSFPNFGHWRNRMQMLLGGNMPVTPALPAAWYDTANIHLCTIRDFEALCESRSIRRLQRTTVDHNHRASTGARLLPNLMGEIAIYRLGRG